MSIAIIDADSVMFSIGNPNKVLDELGQPIKVRSQAGNMVFQYVDKTNEQLAQSADFVMETILTNCQADSYIAYLKGLNTTKSRKLINPLYKANRPLESPKWWEFVKDYLTTNWLAVQVDNIEVDDAVNITRLALQNSFIVAIDNDLLSLEGKHFKWRVKDSLNGEWITTTKEQAETEFWTDMIAGQPGDNIKGLPNKGESFVKKLFEKSTQDSKCWTIFKAYIDHFGEDLGIREYYKNYTSLKILDSYEGFIIPEPVKYEKKIVSIFD